MALAIASWHSKTCSGCPICSETLAAMLDEQPWETSVRLTRENAVRSYSSSVGLARSTPSVQRTAARGADGSLAHRVSV
jgi:hypothetical protein